MAAKLYSNNICYNEKNRVFLIQPIQEIMKKLFLVLLPLLILVAFFVSSVNASGLPENKNDLKEIATFISKAKQNYTTFPEKSVIYGKQALKLARKTGDNNQIAGALLTISVAFYYGNKSDSCEKYCREVLALDINGKGALSKKSYALNLISIINKNKGNYEEALKYAVKAMNYNRLSNDDRNYACALSTTAAIIKKMGRYDRAADSLYKALKLFVLLEDTTNQIKALNNIANLYMDMGRDSLATGYYLKAKLLMANDTGSQDYAGILTNIGILFFNKMQYDSALFYYKKALKIYNLAENIIEEAGMYQNIGNALVAKKEYDEGLKKLHAALIIFKKEHQPVDVANAQLDIGNAYMQSGRFDAAKKYLYRAEWLSDSLKNYYIHNNALFALYQFSLKQKKYKHALEYYQKYVADKDSVEGMKTKNKILELKAKYETERKENRIKILEHREGEQKAENRLLWLVIVLIFIVFLFIMILALVKRKSEKKAEKLRIDHLNRENELKSNQLAIHALNMMQKNKMLRELGNELNLLEKQLNKDEKTQLKKIRRTITKNLNSEREWNIFHHYFSYIHPSFFETLKEKHKTLTTYDIRLAALIRFNLSTHEIAAALNISPGSVKTARHRLKKKLNLQPDDNLDRFLGNI